MNESSETQEDREMPQDPIVVAIDGPAGSGKSTVAKMIADRTSLEYLDTGAMYRAVTYAVLRRQVDPEDADAAAAVAQNCTIAQEPDGRVLVDDLDVTIEIRSNLVSSVVSTVSAHESVRRELVSQQRQWIRRRNGGVLDGRDIGTAVFPDALLKVYLVADPHVRAARRALESVDPADAPEAYAAECDRLLGEMRRRDTFDSEREHDPLRKADDAITVDTSDMTIEDVVVHILELLDGVAPTSSITS